MLVRKDSCKSCTHLRHHTRTHEWDPSTPANLYLCSR